MVKEGHLELWLPSTGLKTPEDLAQELKAILEQIYNTPWRVEAITRQVNTQTQAEIDINQKKEAIIHAGQRPEIRKILNLFEGSAVTDVTQKSI